MIEKVTIFVGCALVVSLLLVFWHQGNLGGMPTPSSLQAGWYWIAIVALMMLPIIYMTIWPATLLSPGRVGMLLMAEVLVGVVSAAMLTDEQFGLRELTGAVLIISAGVVEVMRPQKIVAPAAESGPES